MEPLIGDLFIARFVDCQFDKSKFPTLGGGKAYPYWKKLSCYAKNLVYLDQRLNLCEQEVQKFLHLQSVANQSLDAFTNIKCVIKSHIPTGNAPVRIDLPTKNPQIDNSTICKKRGRHLGSKGVNPRKSEKKNKNLTKNKVDQNSNCWQFNQSSQHSQKI